MNSVSWSGLLILADGPEGKPPDWGPPGLSEAPVAIGRAVCEVMHVAVLSTGAGGGS